MALAPSRWPIRRYLMPSLTVRNNVTSSWPLPWGNSATASTSTLPIAPDRSWDALLVCTAIYILTAVGRIHQLFPVIDLVRPAILAGVLAIVLYLMDSREDRRLRHLALRPVKYLVALFIWMTLSMCVALVLGNSFDLVVNNFLKTAVMFLIVAGAVRGVRDVERLALVYLVSATLYAAVVIFRFDVGADGRLGHLYYYDANDFATFAVTAIPLALYFLHASRGWAGRALAAAAVGTLVLAFVRSGSRGGFVAIVAVAVFIVLRYSAIPVRRRIWATSLIAVVLLATAGGKYWDQMGTIISDTDYNRTNESGRLQIWERGLGYMASYPIFGVGPSNFPTAEGTLSPLADRQQRGAGVRWNAAHNSYVQVGAELGLPGLVLFVGLLLAGFGALRAVVRDAVADADRRRKNLAQAMTASLVGFAVGAVFLSLAYSEMLYMLLALTVGLHKISILQRSPVRIRP
jgi:O-antigen ligase